MEAHYSEAHQTFVAFPCSGHSVSPDSPLSDGSHCGAQLMAEFMADPTAVLDTTCVDETQPLDFDPSMAYADFWFGTQAAARRNDRRSGGPRVQPHRRRD